MAQVLVALAKESLNGDPHCGDQGAWWSGPSTTTLCLADGLGHGKQAEIAALSAIDYVSDHLDLPLPTLFEGCDRAIRSTRGVAMSIAVFDHGTHQLSYAGVGNTRMMIFGTRGRSFSNAFGIVGGGHRKIFVETIAVAPSEVIIMFSDGLPETIARPENRPETPSVLAHSTLQLHGKGTDDAAVLVAWRGDR